MDFQVEDTSNLSQRNVIRRLRGGIVFLMLALLLAAFFEHVGSPASRRVWLFIPFFLAGNAFFQAIFKTCGVLALRGRRHTEEGEEMVADKEDRERALRAGKKQLLFSVSSAALLTALFIVVD